MSTAADKAVAIDRNTDATAAMLGQTETDAGLPGAFAQKGGSVTEGLPFKSKPASQLEATRSGERPSVSVPP